MEIQQTISNVLELSFDLTWQLNGPYSYKYDITGTRLPIKKRHNRLDLENFNNVTINDYECEQHTYNNKISCKSIFDNTDQMGGVFEALMNNYFRNYKLDNFGMFYTCMLNHTFSEFVENNDYLTYKFFMINNFDDKESSVCSINITKNISRSWLYFYDNIVFDIDCKFGIIKNIDELIE